MDVVIAANLLACLGSGLLPPNLWVHWGAGAHLAAVSALTVFGLCVTK
jgi:hypothetical protein